MAYLDMKNVSKSFGTLVALDNVSLSVQKGTIHALLGENGAGKSTLMNILYGMYQQNEGTIYLDNEEIDIKDSKTALDHGIGMVHQHFTLVPPLTVIENVILGYDKISRVGLQLQKAAKRFEELCQRFNMDISPWAVVEDLSIGQQQRLEILKALFRDVSLLILDEPTAVLTPQETETLFSLLKQLTDEGLTIIFITHKLAEVMNICDCCTVLRNGRVVSEVAVSEIESKEQLASMMVGSNVDLIIHKEEAQTGDVILSVEELCFDDEDRVRRVDDISLAVKSGEILGVCGVDGNGQSELIRCIMGLLHPTGGSISICGEDVTGKTTREVLNHHVSHIPEDRLKMAMIKEFTVNENLALMAYRDQQYGRFGFMNWKWITEQNIKICEEYNVKTQGMHVPAGTLSGGNQQKMVVGRELDREPTLLIAVHPSRGLDVGATKYIQNRLIQERDRGAAILLVSTELDEILELSDRIIVLYRGRAMSTMQRKAATREHLGLLMAGISPKNTTVTPVTM
ncbi:MAG TPA: ABC transporter ATP-binding protein [Clostridiaceae bacterium]|jgi:ABC-type uncharacterized transport system ATPase subunit|nr:ABC transporter ATP-binding protein [Clostridiaceae bacterium]